MEGFENDIRDALGGKDVASDYSSVIRGGEERFGRDFDDNWFETALIEGNILGDETTEAVDDGTVGNISEGISRKRLLVLTCS